MGYYSNFRILTTVEGRKTFENYVKEHTEKNEINLFNYLDVDKTDLEKDVSLFGGDDIKWYTFCGFAEIDNFVKALEFLKEKGIPYNFVRLGEELDDMEYDSCKENELSASLSVKREIRVWSMENAFENC